MPGFCQRRRICHRRGPTLQLRFNRPGHDVIDHYTYAIVTDGDLMEGVCFPKLPPWPSLAPGQAHLPLRMTNASPIDGSTDLAFTEDRVRPLCRLRLAVLARRPDGNDVEAIDQGHPGGQSRPAAPRSSYAAPTLASVCPPARIPPKHTAKLPCDEELNNAKINLGGQSSRVSSTFRGRRPGFLPPGPNQGRPARRGMEQAGRYLPQRPRRIGQRNGTTA